MARAAALRTYGLMSAVHFLMVSMTMLPIMRTLLPIMRTLMPDRTRRAMVRMRGLGSERSFWKVLMERRARSGSDSAWRRR